MYHLHRFYALGRKLSKNGPVIEDQAPRLFPIRTVSELTGVNSITLRAWENRYGLIEPIRKESGHRLYSQQHIDLINRVVGLMDRGMRIGQIKPFLDAANNRTADQDSAPISDTWRRFEDGMISGIIRFDEAALENIYNEALSNHSIETVTRRLITPLLVELGKRWESGLGTAAEEHFFGFYLRNKLGARFHHRKINQRGPKLLMACLPGERHEIGMLQFALVVNEVGYRPVVLGADMPLAELEPAAAKIGADAIVLSGILTPAKQVLSEQLPNLSSAAHVPILLGGQVSINAMDDLKRMGIEPLGTDLDTGLRKLESVVPLD
jgi:DNA-binding transcriptional MerR regulator/methylmalonyl-CoA mutase cobalamin-binding subunit